MIAVVAALALACGGRSKPPAKPPAPDPKQLAALLERDMVELAEIASRLRGKCSELVSELRPLVTRMREHFEHVHRMQADPKLGVEFKAEVASYDERAAGRID